MTTRATERAAPDSANGARAPRPGARQLLVRFLTLREGSIVVVTILAIIYFSIKVDNRPQQNTFNLHYIHDF